MPGSIRTRHPRPTEAGTKASWQEFLHSEPRARGTSPPPPQKNQPPTLPAPESCPVGFENAPPGSSTGVGWGGKKRTRGGKNKSEDLPLHRCRLNKRPGEVDYFFPTPPQASFPACPSPSSLLAPGVAGSLARRPSVQAATSPGLPPSWFEHDRRRRVLE